MAHGDRPRYVVKIAKKMREANLSHFSDGQKLRIVGNVDDLETVHIHAPLFQKSQKLLLLRGQLSRKLVTTMSTEDVLCHAITSS